MIFFVGPFAYLPLFFVIGLLMLLYDVARRYKVRSLFFYGLFLLAIVVAVTASPP